MGEIFKNIKTLFFTYMSIVFLLFFAVLQSSQEIYDTALEQLNEIERLVASYDEKAIQNLISIKAPDASRKENDEYKIPSLNLSVSFAFNVSDLDFASLKGKFEGQAPAGFDFGAGNQDRLPDDFTKVDSVKDFIITLLPPRSIVGYKQVHNGTLADIILPVFSPEFTSARVEAFEYKKSTYNSIEMINTSEYQNHKVFDQLLLVEESASKVSTCNMRLVKTATNGRYAYFCSISNFEHEGVSYSGARIFIPAKYSTVLLKKSDLMELYGIPIDRRVAFKNAYKELFDTTKAYSFLEFEKIESIIESEKSRNPSKLSIFGAEINISILTKLIFPILIMVCLYIYLHLKEARRRVINSNGKWNDYDVPWVGIYTENINKSAIFTQLIIFPVALMGIIHVKSSLDTTLVLSWVFCIGLLLINFYNYRVIVDLRATLHNNSMQPTAKAPAD
ncbi:hypothetical protein KFE80_00325 [bacterium SCSIO 12696]|nr:hypothetical protein KFE80_00325 [bacterium SCSIO 12696]